jgi:hypothetical protein
MGTDGWSSVRKCVSMNGYRWMDEWVIMNEADEYGFTNGRKNH